MIKKLRNWCGVTACVFFGMGVVGGVSLAADSYPNRPVTFIVPFAPGGPADVMGRLLTRSLTESLGQPVIVVNRPGAGGNIGTNAIAQADPDGYTIGISLISSLAISPSLYSTLPYDVEKDIAPISMVGIATPAILAHPSTPFDTFEGMIEFAKENPGVLNYSTPGVGTAPHLAAEQLSALADIELTHVPYKGTAPASQDLLAGVIPIGFESSLVTAAKSVDAGLLKAIAVLTQERSELLPDTPTVAELGYPGFDASNWFSLVAPAGTPVEIIDKLNQLTTEVLSQPETIESLASIGVVAQSMSPAELKAYIAQETEHWNDVITMNNITLE